LLVPVKVEPCDLVGILKQVIHIDLVGLDGDNARKRLLSKLNPGRTKPATAPTFPGTGVAEQQSSLSADTQVTWRDIDSPLVAQWQTSGRSSYSTATLEVHTLSIDGGSFESRALRALPEEITILGRQSGLFEQSESVDATVDETRAIARTDGRNRNSGDRGIAVYKSREIISWAPLPHDNLGAVFDEEDVRNRITALLATHVSSGILIGENVAFAVSVGPVMMLTVGSASMINNRSSASLVMSSSANTSVQIEPTDYVSLRALTASTDEIADELTARLALKLDSVR
jgi:hypothetical protein